TPWLERDRAQNLQTAMLYRRARRALQFLAGRRRAEIPAVVSSRRGWIAVLVPTLVIPLCFARELGVLGFLLLLFAVPVWMTIGSLLWLSPKQTAPESRAKGLMALISEYRDLASFTVSRLRQGALGPPQEHGGRVIVCIDELDKIIRVKELRAFLRRIKAIF